MRHLFLHLHKPGTFRDTFLRYQRHFKPWFQKIWALEIDWCILGLFWKEILKNRNKYWQVRYLGADFKDSTTRIQTLFLSTIGRAHCTAMRPFWQPSEPEQGGSQDGEPEPSAKPSSGPRKVPRQTLGEARWPYRLTRRVTWVAREAAMMARWAHEVAMRAISSWSMIWGRGGRN